MHRGKFVHPAESQRATWWNTNFFNTLFTWKYKCMMSHVMLWKAIKHFKTISNFTAQTLKALFCIVIFFVITSAFLHSSAWTYRNWKFHFFTILSNKVYFAYNCKKTSCSCFCPSVPLFVRLSILPAVCLFVRPFVRLSVRLFVRSSVRPRKILIIFSCKILVLTVRMIANKFVRSWEISYSNIISYFN